MPKLQRNLRDIVVWSRVIRAAWVWSHSAQGFVFYLNSSARYWNFFFYSFWSLGRTQWCSEVIPGSVLMNPSWWDFMGVPKSRLGWRMHGKHASPFLFYLKREKGIRRHSRCKPQCLVSRGPSIIIRCSSAWLWRPLPAAGRAQVASHPLGLDLNHGYRLEIVRNFLWAFWVPFGKTCPPPANIFFEREIKWYKLILIIFVLWTLSSK